MNYKEIYGSPSGLTGELTTDRIVKQSFLALYNYLDAIQIHFATYRRKNTSSFVFKILDADLNEVFNHEVKASIFVDNQYFSLPVHVDLIQGQRYWFLIGTVDGVLGNTVTCKYGFKKHHDELFLIGEKMIHQSELDCIFIYAHKAEELPVMCDNSRVVPDIKQTEGLVSVIIPVRNDSEYIGKLFDTLRKQTYNFIEIIVVDDFSDNYDEYVKSVDISGLNVKFIRLEKHSGACVARNVGSQCATGEFLFFCDVDLSLNNNIFQKMVQSLHSNPDMQWVYCNFSVGLEKRSFCNFNLKELMKRNLCSTMSMMRRNVFSGFNVQIKRLQDWDLFLRMAENGHKGVWINEILFSAADRPGITRNSISWEEAVSDLRRFHPLLGK